MITAKEAELILQKQHAKTGREIEEALDNAIRRHLKRNTTNNIVRIHIDVSRWNDSDITYAEELARDHGWYFKYRVDYGPLDVYKTVFLSSKPFNKRQAIFDRIFRSRNA